MAYVRIVFHKSEAPAEPQEPTRQGVRVPSRLVSAKSAPCAVRVRTPAVTGLALGGSATSAMISGFAVLFP